VKRHPILMLACAAALLTLPAAASSQPRARAAVRAGTSRAAVAVAVAPRRTIVGRRYYSRPYYYGAYSRPYYSGAYFYGPWYGLGYGLGYGYPFGYGYGPAYPAYYGYGGNYGGAAALRLQVNPRNTEVFIDGYFAGVVDDFDGFFKRLDLAPGEHDVELFLPGHRTVHQKVYLQPGRTFRVKYTLEALQPGDPEPVRPQTTAPPPAQNRPPYRGAPGQRQPPAARDDAAVNAAQSGYGTLAVRVQPGDAEVLIDGERWTGTQQGDRLEVQLSAGTHNIEVQKSGFRGYATDVTVRNGQTATLNIALAKQ